MHPADSTRFPPLTIANGLLVVDGYGLKVSVERGHLVVADGMCEDRRRGRFGRATSDLKRLVVHGHTGIVSLEALLWLKDVGAAFVQIDTDGQVIIASGPMGLRDARLRRAQALATRNASGVEVTRGLLRRKIGGQAKILDDLTAANGSAAVLRDCLAVLERANALNELAIAESRAAAAYWEAWTDVPVKFVRSDLRKVPEHWLRFGQRSSPLTGSPRLAANPANAIVNYAHAILESEARIACLAVGLDPGLGIVHADQGARDSLALDIMEAVRPQVEGYVLNLLQSNLFKTSDFFETRQGVCRVLPPLSHHLAQLHPVCARWVAPVAEWVAQSLIATPGARITRIPTPLTQANRSAGRARLRRQVERKVSGPGVKLPHVCRICGTLLPDTDTLYCSDCHQVRRRELAGHYTAAGLEALTQLRARGADPAHGKRAGEKRGARNAQHRRDESRWNREHGRSSSPADFVRGTLPPLQAIPLSAISEATGLSRGYASMIRRGLYVPHPRHWEALAKLGRSLAVERTLTGGR